MGRFLGSWHWGCRRSLAALGIGALAKLAVPGFAFGHVVSQYIGGYLIGVAIESFSLESTLPPEVRLLIVTGFLGGLTTFSTFSLEAVSLIARGQLGWAMVHVSTHVLGSLLMTWLGILTVQLMRS